MQIQLERDFPTDLKQRYLQDHLSFFLRDVSVDHVRFRLNVVAQRQLVCVAFRFAEDYRASLAAAVHLENGTDGSGAVKIAALNCQMLQ